MSMFIQNPEINIDRIFANEEKITVNHFRMFL